MEINQITLVHLVCCWILILCGIVSGAYIGMFLHRQSGMGSYTSWSRRLFRLGHIACMGMAAMNLAFVLSINCLYLPETHLFAMSVCFIAAGVLMPVICFLSAWIRQFKHLFCLPVVSLLAAVILLLQSIISTGNNNQGTTNNYEDNTGNHERYSSL